MIQRYDFLIVGAGLYGATFAHFATQSGRKCLVIDKRSHIGGNTYCEKIEGIVVHKYGPHVFHTSDKEVWDFVNSFIKFNHFRNSPLAISSDGQCYNLPFNMNTFHQLWGVTTPKEAECIINEQRSISKKQILASGYASPKNLEHQALLLVGEDIYEKFIKGYTRKQWGLDCKELPPYLIERLPVRFTFDNNYFNDLYQGVPEGGYNLLIKSLLKGSRIITNADFFINRTFWEQRARKIIYTGPIDQFFEFRLGRLPYRTLNFETKILPISNFQGNAVVNYTSENVPYTRIIEHKHFETFGDRVYSLPHTIITKEYPAECRLEDEPFYPINTQVVGRVVDEYRQLARKEKNVIFGGRLGEYRYYDMGPIIRNIMDIFKYRTLL